jgi:hypothetical protein
MTTPKNDIKSWRDAINEDDPENLVKMAVLANDPAHSIYRTPEHIIVFSETKDFSSQEPGEVDEYLRSKGFDPESGWIALKNA